MTEWLPIVQALGLPGAIILISVFAAWKVIPWLGENVAKPMVQKHLSFIDVVQSSVSDISDGLKTVVEAQTKSTAEILFGFSKMTDTMPQGFTKITESQFHLIDHQGKLMDHQIELTKAQTCVSREMETVLRKNGTEKK